MLGELAYVFSKKLQATAKTTMYTLAEIHGQKIHKNIYCVALQKLDTWIQKSCATHRLNGHANGKECVGSGINHASVTAAVRIDEQDN